MGAIADGLAASVVSFPSTSLQAPCHLGRRVEIPYGVLYGSGPLTILSVSERTDPLTNLSRRRHTSARCPNWTSGVPPMAMKPRRHTSSHSNGTRLLPSSPALIRTFPTFENSTIERAFKGGYAVCAVYEVQSEYLTSMASGSGVSIAP
ncbi:hypothetical protein K474DRAFT_733279 [Panus rudis PR-1116 ss-1]|nr:hypothetical protein K474DRAFT_733279 [Panus rudis PR-1116 ss-1]